MSGSGTSRTLEFDDPPNYEVNSSYEVTVEVTAGSESATRTVTVTVTNEDDPGEVTISPDSPRVGETVTAALSDEDGGVRGDPWSWSSEAAAARGEDGQGDNVPRVGNTWTAWKGAVGRYLVASRTYSDNHGSGKSASGRTKGVVRPNKPKAPPDFEAVRGDGQVSLSWGAADDQGATIDYYQWHRNGTTWESTGTNRTKTVTGLTNGTTYTFYVRAHNSVDFSPAASASVTPAGTPGAPQSLATDRQGGNGFMELTWEAAAANGSAILHYYYRYKKTGDDGWRGWYRRTGGADARSKTWSNFDDGSSYVFHVRARNDVGYGTTAQISASALGPGGSRGARGEHEETEDELMPEGEVPEPGEDEVVVFAKPVADGPEGGWLAAADSLAVRPGPNPFNPETTLRFQLPAAAPVTLTIHNTAGQRVVEMIRGEILTAGLHERVWFGTDEVGRPVASGLYLYRLVAGDQVRVGKLALIR